VVALLIVLARTWQVWCGRRAPLFQLPAHLEAANVARELRVVGELEDAKPLGDDQSLGQGLEVHVEVAIYNNNATQG